MKPVKSSIKQCVFYEVMMGSFWSKVNAVEAWHAKLVDRPWLQPLKPTKFVIALIVLSTLIAAGMNWYVRHWQYQVWEQNPEIFYLDDGTPLFTTADAPYFLGVAQTLKEGGTLRDFRQRRLYPSNQDWYTVEPLPEYGLRDAPLLSVFISWFAKDSSQKELLIAANKLIPLTAVISSVMIVFAFGAAGYWLEGSVAAAGAGLSFAFITRSGAGRIDTDQLNLGFFYFLTGLVIFAARARTTESSLGLTVLAGAAFWLFDWWYPKPLFGWAFLIGLLWLSFVIHKDIKRIFIQSVLFVGISGLWIQGLGIGEQNAYLVQQVVYDGFIFPNAHSTITELQKVGLSEILSRISGSIWLGVFSVIGLFLWGLRHPATVIVFGPAAAFALLNFLIGNRAIFYSAPMLWFGFGFLLVCVLRYSFVILRKHSTEFAAVPVAVLAGFSAVWLASPTSYIQAPTFDGSVLKAFQSLSKSGDSGKAVVATWWDYGYASMFINGLPTLHDGGLQNTPNTFLIANSLVTRSQEQAAKRLKLLASAGNAAVLASLKGMPETVSKSQKTEIYLVLTKDMANWMPSISKIGNWDVFAGEPVPLPGVRPGAQMTYENLDCKRSENPQIPLCNGQPLNLETGEFGQGAFFDGVVYSKDGLQVSGKKFPSSNSVFMLHSELGERGQRNMLIHRNLYFSVFHQLFHAGRLDERYFKMIYDDYPQVRIYRVR